MNREDIIRMARSAIRLAAEDTDLTNFDQEATILDRYQFLYWFAKEATTAERERIAAERDALLGALKDATKTIEHFGYFLAAIERACAAIKAVEGEKR